MLTNCMEVSSTSCREVFKNCLKDLGLDYNLYGLHSLRSGEATSVVSLCFDF